LGAAIYPARDENRRKVIRALRSQGGIGDTPGRSLVDEPKLGFGAPDRSHAPGLFLLRDRLAWRPRASFVKRSRRGGNDRRPKSFRPLLIRGFDFRR